MSMGTDPIPLGGFISVIVIVVLAQVIRSIQSGRLASMIETIQAGGQAAKVSERLKEIRDVAEKTLDATEENGDHIDDLAEAIVTLHRDDDDVNEEDLRRKVGVEELSDDILARGKRRGDD